MKERRDASTSALVLIGFAGLSARRIAQRTSAEFYWRCSRRVAVARIAGQPVWHICDRAALIYEQGRSLAPHWHDPVFSIANDDALGNPEFAAMLAAEPTTLVLLVGPGCEGFARRTAEAAERAGIQVAIETTGKCRNGNGGESDENSGDVRNHWIVGKNSGNGAGGK